jgi:hypothetical protein
MLNNSAPRDNSLGVFICAMSFFVRFIHTTENNNHEVTNMNKNAPYFVAAKAALINWNSMSIEDANEFIETKSRAEIEQATGAYGSVYDASNRIAHALGLSDKEAYQFTQEMLGNSDSTAMLDKVKEQFALVKAQCPERAQELTAGLLLDACDDVHKGWTGRNASPFFGKKDIKDQQYQYGTSEMIGWKEVKADLLFLSPIADAVGLEINEDDMKRLYGERVLAYCQHIQDVGGPGIEGVGGPGIDTIVELIDVIDNLENGKRIMLSPEIAAAWENDPALVQQIAHEVSTKGIGADAQLIQTMIDMGILDRDNPTGLEDPSGR